MAGFLKQSIFASSRSPERKHGQPSMLQLPKGVILTMLVLNAACGIVQPKSPTSTPTESAPATLTPTPCAPPDQIPDVFDAGQTLPLTEWSVWKGERIEYETGGGSSYFFSVEPGQGEGDIEILVEIDPARPGIAVAELGRYQLADGRAVQIPMATSTDSGKYIINGPIVISNCSGVLQINDQYKDRITEIDING
ncbi:hypothetical protein HY612_01620 [Candidatus Roizmanbacteria bacterium]|nr:hypothetical protein [Candidatus Roizmanbacteria bacterium]